jgi:HK97 family phage portal protein
VTRLAQQLVGSIVRRQSISAAADAARLGGGIAGLQGGSDFKQTRDYLEAYADRAWVYACVSSQAKAMKQAPLGVLDPDPDGEGLVAVAEHPLLGLLRRPNPLTRGGLYREQQVIDLETTGNHYSEIVFSRDGVQPVELWRMDPSRVRIIVDQDTGLVSGYLYYPSGGGAPVTLDAGQVWHRRYANPLDPYRGIGPLQAARDAIVFDYASNAQINAYFSNGMRLSGVLTGPDGATETEIKLARLLMERRHTGASAHRALILRGEWKYEPVGADPKDVDWAEGRRMSREDVCAAFNVPPPVAGDFTRSTYSNYEEAVRDFWRGNIAEKYAALDEDLTNDILPLYPDQPEDRACVHDLSVIPAMREDRDKAMTRAVAGLTGGVLSWNESRSEVGVDPRDEDFRRVPISVREVAYGDDEPLLPAPVAPPASPAPDEPAADGGDDETSTDPDDPAVNAATRRAAPTIDPQRHAAFDAAETRAARTSQIIDTTTAAISDALAQHRDSLFAALSGHAKKKRPIIPPGWTLLDILHAITQNQAAWIDLQAALDDITNAAHQLSIEAAYDTAATLGLDTSYGVDDPIVQQLLDALATRPDGVSGMAGAVRQEILDIVSRAAKEQATIDEITDRIVDYYPEWIDEPWRAERVARTETAYAYNLAALAAYEAGGFDHVLVTDGDEHDDACREANGSVWPIATARLRPVEHPNCVRAFAPAISGQTP